MANPMRDLCEGVAVQLRTVTDIGHVYRRAAYIKSLSEWMEALKYTDEAGEDTGRAWVVEPASPAAASDIAGLGRVVHAGHEFGVRAVGIQVIDAAKPDEEGALDTLLDLAWLAKRRLDAWTPGAPGGMVGVWLPTAARLDPPETRILPSGHLVWTVVVSRVFQFSEDSFTLDS